MILPKHNLQRGQFYIGILISVGVIGVLSAALFAVVQISYELVIYSRARITARHLAQENIELIRNLPYEDIGTTGGIPSGSLEQTTQVKRNGLMYIVNTDIIYVDDPFDGLAPSDTLANDYKKVRVDVSWEGLASSKKNPITLITDIAPKGIETTTGGGTLSILVFDANGIPVAQSEVQITATDINPPIDLTLYTNDSGRIILPGSPICISCYNITATKDGYSFDKTYTTLEVANPEKPPLTILEGQLTEMSFTIDKTSSVTFFTVNDRDSNFTPLASQTFTLKGEKIIGTDVADEPVFKFEQTIVTNGVGQILVENLEWDNYVSIFADLYPFDISGTNPLHPIALLPDEQIDAYISLTPHTDHTLLSTFMDPSGSPIASVSATLSHITGYEATKSAGSINDPDYGQVFYTNLNPLTYTLDATVSGYTTYNGDISVLNQTLETTILSPEL